MSNHTRIADMNFEEALDQLEQVTQKLESGDTKLEDAIKEYEYGSMLQKLCEEKLKQAKLKIEDISGNTLQEINKIN